MSLANKIGLSLMIWGVWFLVMTGIRRDEGWLAAVSIILMVLGGILLTKPTPQDEQAVATQAANVEVVGEKAGERAISRPEGNSRA